jgi:hypothetical protein
MSKKQIKEAKKRLIEIQSKLPPEKAERSAWKLLEIEQKEARQKERDRQRQEERQRFRENVADITIGITSAIAASKQQPLTPPQPRQYQQEYLAPPTQDVQDTLARLRREIEEEDNRIIQQSLEDAKHYPAARQSKQELIGAFIPFAIALLCFSWLAGSYLGINPSTIQNWFGHETQQE